MQVSLVSSLIFSHGQERPNMNTPEQGLFFLGGAGREAGWGEEKR